MVACANGKGGVGKTSTAVNVAGWFAAVGWRTLLVGLDAQGDAAGDLGLAGDDRNDLGEALGRALRGGHRPEVVLEGVREGLDVVPGGRLLGGVAPDLSLPASALRAAVADYDVCFVDCPPAGGDATAAALAAASHVLVPVRADDASLAGLELVSSQFREAQVRNPGLVLLGVVVFGVEVRATALRWLIRQDLERILGEGVVFDAMVRHAPKAAFEARREGWLSHEHREVVRTNRVEYRRRVLRALRRGDGSHRSLRRYASAAEGLAEDYEALALEVAGRLTS